MEVYISPLENFMVMVSSVELSSGNLREEIEDTRRKLTEINLVKEEGELKSYEAAQSMLWFPIVEAGCEVEFIFTKVFNDKLTLLLTVENYLKIVFVHYTSYDLLFWLQSKKLLNSSTTGILLEACRVFDFSIMLSINRTKRNWE